MTPNDPTPLSNLSSVKFELGQYAAAILYILKSLSLTAANDVEADEAVVRKKKALHERLAKCHIHELRFDDARKTLLEISDHNLQASTRDTLDALSAWRLSGNLKNIERHRKLVFDRLPRLNAHLFVKQISCCVCCPRHC